MYSVFEFGGGFSYHAVVQPAQHIAKKIQSDELGKGQGRKLVSDNVFLSFVLTFSLY